MQICKLESTPWRKQRDNHPDRYQSQDPLGIEGVQNLSQEYLGGAMAPPLLPAIYQLMSCDLDTNLEAPFLLASVIGGRVHLSPLSDEGCPSSPADLLPWR